MTSVLFVCLGNICRSPMADGLFAHMVKQAGLADKIRVDSAGTAGYHTGERAHRGTLNVLKKHDVDYDGRARQFRAADLQTFDYVLAMDNSNFANILRMADIQTERGRTHYTLDDGAQVAMFLHYAHEAGTVREIEVPDPYYDGRFDEVYDLVERGCRALLDEITGG
ncbi:MAG: low molecular weight phosphotyrosine protein phosphatase [Anaerolineaceae bacterium]|nr:MAG: low molecular weight phosphotyrosine protein phosphatase [Anaerolineaceae bacterium]